MARRSGTGRLLRGGFTVVLTGLIGLAAAGTAAAHVTVISPDSSHGPQQVEKGGYSNVTFRVPNEEDSANTVKVTVNFPLETPVASASVEPVPGWNAEITTVTLDEPVTMEHTTVDEAVKTITWTAENGGVAPGRFQRFTVSLGGVPTNTERLVLPVVQTYDDGTVVKWDDPPAGEGEPEPEEPAPYLNLVAAGAQHGQSQGAAPAQGSAASGSADSSAGSDVPARWLGGAGLVVALLALGGVAVSSRRRGSGSA